MEIPAASAMGNFGVILQAFAANGERKLNIGDIGLIKPKRPSEAKLKAYDYLNKLTSLLEVPLWVGQEFDEKRELVGKNLYFYRIKLNRHILEKLFQYSYDHGLSKKVLSIEEVFAPAI